jgi:hypothetical protein
MLNSRIIAFSRDDDMRRIAANIAKLPGLPMTKKKAPTEIAGAAVLPKLIGRA